MADSSRNDDLHARLLNWARWQRNGMPDLRAKPVQWLPRVVQGMEPDEHDAMQVDRALCELAEVDSRQQEAVVLAYTWSQDMSDYTRADKMGVSRATFRRCLKDARLWLRRHL